MSQKRIENRKKVHIAFDIETYTTLSEIAAKKHMTVTELCRTYIYEGISGKICEDNLNIITKVIREQLQVQLKPSVERLAALNVKTGIMAASSTYLTAETLASFVPTEKRKAFDESYEKARKKAIYYMRSKTDDEETM